MGLVEIKSGVIKINRSSPEEASRTLSNNGCTLSWHLFS